MNAFVCPKGHNSSEPDYCSDCGARISAAAPAGTAPDAAPAGQIAVGEQCPACGAPREAAGIAFCEICGCDFAAGPTTAPNPAPTSAPFSAPGSAPPSTPAPPCTPAPPMLYNWAITVSLDPALRDPASPEPPAGILPLTLNLTARVSLIGRRSEVRAIFPEIALSYDDAVSHRHALLQLDDLGALTLRDIGSSNGTRLNGKEIAPMQDHILHDGDQIALGHWSRIAIKAIR